MSSANHTKLPDRRSDWASIEQSMSSARRDDAPWRGPRTFKPAYFAGDDVVEVANRAYQMYITDNALHGKAVFPSIVRYQTEVIEMVLDMLHAPYGAGGAVTTGGTESNFMAVKTARDWAREHLPAATSPKVIVPRSAHPSFDKAGHMLGLRIDRMAHSPDFLADVEAMSAAVDDQTIMLVASAPPYPYGQTDPVTEVAAIAERHGLWMHVDSCLGGFILPFAREFDATIPDFDLAVAGVTSLSVDIHKYGYAAKGISALLLGDEDLDRYQRSVHDDWPGGMYSTANVAGSHSGGAVASAWAVMNYLGRGGYRDVVKIQIDIRERLIAGISAIDGLEVWAKPQAFNFAFGSNELDIFAVADGMADKGWTLGRAAEPASIQLMITVAHAESVDDFLAELAEVTEAVKAGKITAVDGTAVYAN